ncbi:2Fe-2S iron-sulfur cluster-binding protein [Mesorhizobium onobrychidis]|uniref:2Fe-2S iron-sulfur cluster binding domain-containing protein n=1 Tax=Mesorhizobium onobrychidis TaxID=2775404 RepID=A0ABY5QY94_9HYPH|nr:2Fe-2S iron-sulfur cluster-binding protein [Mesorhizobium onobrychidis]UVC15042.1 2Fe-2S iron-sulfur cluster binding domain-containing protein [Mesorhizobium onobrychidis]
MSKLTVIKRDGTHVSLDGEAGVSVMENIRSSGIDEILAICGGCCSCATCHVYVDTDASGALPPMSTDEDELLEGSPHRRPNSRLSCQVPFSAGLNLISVEIAPED